MRDMSKAVELTCCMAPAQSAFLGGCDIGLPQDFSASQADLLNDLLRQRQFQGSPGLDPAGYAPGGSEGSPEDVHRQKTGVRGVTQLCMQACLLKASMGAPEWLNLTGKRVGLL